MNESNPPIIFLMGPTASGKTALAIQLAKIFPIEIISVDSAMIYRGMDIGTGKPSLEELKIVPQHLIDILDPSASYSAAKFREDALELINSIHAKEKMPLFVGGTMLYFKALKSGIATLPSADIHIREKLNLEKQELGLKKLHERLQKIDPVAAKRIHPNDTQRLLRALEVYEISGRTLTEMFTQEQLLTEKYHLIEIAGAPKNRQDLHFRIEQRFQKMLAAGFIDEVRKLRENPHINLTLPAMRSVGYRQVWEYLVGKYDFATMQRKAIAATRQLAKRQLTWLRHWENLHWFYFDEGEDVLSEVVEYLQKSV